ncbi:MAG TPA: transposase [Nitrososphaeraceae archaeon]
MSFECQQQRTDHTGNRSKLSAYEERNSINTMNHLKYFMKYVMNSIWKTLILIWYHASFHVSKMMNDYIKTQKDWLTIIHLPKKASYLNSNERKVNQLIKSCVCVSKFYENIENQKAAVSEYLGNRFGKWVDGGLCYDT